jgi:hypothetical protein
MRVPMLYRAARSVLGTLFGRASPQRGATLAEDQISNSFVTVSLTNSATAFYYSTNLYTTLYSTSILLLLLLQKKQAFLPGPKHIIAS